MKNIKLSKFVRGYCKKKKNKIESFFEVFEVIIDNEVRKNVRFI